MRRVNRVQTGKVFKLVHLKRIFSGWRAYFTLACVHARFWLVVVDRNSVRDGER